MIEGFLQRNLWAILAGLSMAYSGYVTGQATTTNRIDNLERDNSRLEARFGALENRVDARVPGLSCMVRTMDRILEKTGTARPCDQEVSE